jgi:hypothetical protein
VAATGTKVGGNPKMLKLTYVQTLQMNIWKYLVRKRLLTQQIKVELWGRHGGWRWMERQTGIITCREDGITFGPTLKSRPNRWGKHLIRS